MKSNTVHRDYVASHDYLVCIDSDGCAFDTMEIKHKECFCPATIDNWDLQAISKYAREAWDYVNLYSQSRGCSRFHALLQVLDLLSERQEVRARNFVMPDATSLRRWVNSAPVLNNDAVAELTDDPVMARTLEWSLDMNRRVAKLVRNIPPFPFVEDCLARLSEVADIVIVSATPRAALLHEWQEHGIDRYVTSLGAQEDGSKKEIISFLMSGYAPEKALMIGDAPGDYAAAAANGILFYPVRPNDEVQSWQEFCTQGLDLFLDGRYAGAEMERLLARFDKCLPKLPPWKLD